MIRLKIIDYPYNTMALTPTEGIPVPMKDELLTKEQAVSLIKDHIDDRKKAVDLRLERINDLWLKNTTLFTILEGDAERGRAIAANAFQTSLVLGEYDLYKDKLYCAGYSTEYEVEESGNKVCTPSMIIEFTYDFGLSKDRFMVVRTVSEYSYLLSERDMPKEWVKAILSMGMRPGYKCEPLCDDPIPEYMRSLFPKSHMIRTCDSQKLMAHHARRSLKGLIKLAAYSDKKSFHIVDKMISMLDWCYMMNCDHSYVLKVLPEVMKKVIGSGGNRYMSKSAAVNLSLKLLYRCLQGQNFATPIRLNVIYKGDWKKLCTIFETMEELYGRDENIIRHIMNYLLIFLSADISYRKKTGLREMIISYIRGFVNRCGMDDDLLASKVLFDIITEAKRSNIDASFWDDDSDSFEDIDEEYVNYEDSWFFSSVNWDSLRTSPVIEAYNMIFGLARPLSLDSKWLRYIVIPEYFESEYRHIFEINPFDQIDIYHENTRQLLKELFSLAPAFILDKKNLRGGEKLLLAKTLISLNSEELLQQALKRGLTTSADLKRAMKYIVENEVKTPMIPFLIYVTKKGA